MRVRSLTLPALLLPALTMACVQAAGDDSGGAAVAAPQAVLWRDPGAMPSRDLFYGSGSKAHQPQSPFTFVEEDLGGTNPKFVVRDANGLKWKVKLGVEAKPEVAAARIVWAAGYYTTEDYLLARMQVDGLPARLHRGQKLVLEGGVVQNVRLKREDGKKVGIWQWKQDPFTGTREWYGLRVVMALINNWDLKDVNNAVYQEKEAGKIYLVSDLGSSFGSARPIWPLEKAKGYFPSYQHSAFIRRQNETTVDLADPGRPDFVWLVHPFDYFRRVHMEWIGRNIPREDCRWIGTLLSGLSRNQLQDAFRAAGYSDTEVEEFAGVLQQRIAQLAQL